MFLSILFTFNPCKITFHSITYEWFCQRRHYVRCSIACNHGDYDVIFLLCNNEYKVFGSNKSAVIGLVRDHGPYSSNSSPLMELLRDKGTNVSASHNYTGVPHIPHYNFPLSPRYSTSYDGFTSKCKTLHLFSSSLSVPCAPYRHLTVTG